MRRYALMLLLCSAAFADINTRIADAIEKVAAQSGVPASVYYTLIDVESGFRPYLVSIVTDPGKAGELEALRQYGYEIENHPYKDRRIVSIAAWSTQAIVAVARMLTDMNIRFDAGLMQISSENINPEEIESIFEPYRNIATGSNVLAWCAERYGDTRNTIECYNKGARPKKTYDYFEKFAQKYVRNFEQERP